MKILLISFAVLVIGILGASKVKTQIIPPNIKYTSPLIFAASIDGLIGGRVYNGDAIAHNVRIAVYDAATVPPTLKSDTGMDPIAPFATAGGGFLIPPFTNTSYLVEITVDSPMEIESAVVQPQCWATPCAPPRVFLTPGDFSKN